MAFQGPKNGFFSRNDGKMCVSRSISCVSDCIFFRRFLRLTHEKCFRMGKNGSESLDFGQENAPFQGSERFSRVFLPNFQNANFLIVNGYFFANFVSREKKFCQIWFWHGFCMIVGRREVVFVWAGSPLGRFSAASSSPAHRRLLAAPNRRKKLE